MSHNRKQDIVKEVLGLASTGISRFSDSWLFNHTHGQPTLTFTIDLGAQEDEFAVKDVKSFMIDITTTDIGKILKKLHDLPDPPKDPKKEAIKKAIEQLQKLLEE